MTSLYILCIMMCMRTNIDLDDSLLAAAGKYSKAGSKRGVVHEALATYVAVKSEEQRRATYRDRLQEIRARASKVRLRSDSRAIIRSDRDTR